MNLKYNEENFKNGEEQYKNIQKKLEILINTVNSYQKQAQNIENFTPKFNYDGIFKDIFDKLSASIETLNSKLELSKNIILRAKGIINSYNNNSLDQASAIFLLSNLKNTYFNSSSSEFNLTSVPTTNINYNNIYDEGYTPQGITIIGNTVIISAYHEKKSSKLFMYNLNDPTSNYSVLLDTSSHVGGVTYDSKNHVLLVTGSSGKINAYNYDAIAEMATRAKKATYEGSTPIIDVTNTATSAKVKLQSNLNINYNKLSNGNKQTNYNASSVYYDNKTNEIYINRFSKNNGKLISSEVIFDSEKGTYNMSNPKTIDIDNGVQSISTYHKDNQKYLIESRSYGMNQSQITVRNITGNKNEIIGTKVLPQKYSEGIQVDNSGKAIIAFESGRFEKNNTTSTIDINEIIKENNQRKTNITILTNKYEKGVPTTNGYE